MSFWAWAKFYVLGIGKDPIDAAYQAGQRRALAIYEENIRNLTIDITSRVSEADKALFERYHAERVVVCEMPYAIDAESGESIIAQVVELKPFKINITLEPKNRYVTIAPNIPGRNLREMMN